MFLGDVTFLANGSQWFSIWCSYVFVSMFSHVFPWFSYVFQLPSASEVAFGEHALADEEASDVSGATRRWASGDYPGPIVVMIIILPNLSGWWCGYHDYLVDYFLQFSDFINQTT